MLVQTVEQWGNMGVIELVKDKKVLFITTKNLDYIRNTQELRTLRENASHVEVVYSSKKNYIFRIFDVWMKTSKLKIRKCDVVFVGFEPQFIIPYIGKRFKNKIVVIDCFISVYDTLVCDRKKFKMGSIFAKYFHYIDSISISKADWIITDTKAHASYFIDEFHGDPRKFQTLYLEADISIYYARNQNKPKELKDKFVILYFGSILPLQGIEIIIEAIRTLKDETALYFDIIGPIPKKLNKPIQNNVHYTEWLPQEELAEHIAYADLCLAGHFNNDIDKSKRTIPGKAIIFELMRKPMVLGNSIANHELFKEDDKHYFTEMGNAKELVRIIKNVLIKEKFGL